MQWVASKFCRCFWAWGEGEKRGRRGVRGPTCPGPPIPPTKKKGHPGRGRGLTRKSASCRRPSAAMSSPGGGGQRLEGEGPSLATHPPPATPRPSLVDACPIPSQLSHWVVSGGRPPIGHPIHPSMLIGCPACPPPPPNTPLATPRTPPPWLLPLPPAPYWLPYTSQLPIGCPPCPQHPIGHHPQIPIGHLICSLLPVGCPICPTAPHWPPPPNRSSPLATTPHPEHSIGHSRPRPQPPQLTQAPGEGGVAVFSEGPQHRLAPALVHGAALAHCACRPNACVPRCPSPTCATPCPAQTPGPPHPPPRGAGGPGAGGGWG